MTTNDLRQKQRLTAQNAATSLSELQQLSQSADMLVRAYVANNRSADERLLASLANDSHPTVKTVALIRADEIKATNPRS